MITPCSNVASPASRCKKHGFSLRLAVCFLSVAVSSLLVGLAEHSLPGPNLIWIANGLLLSHLLLAPRWRWPHYLAAGYAGLVVGSIPMYGTWQANLGFNALNLLEILIGAVPMRLHSRELPKFAESRYVLRFLAFAVFLGPAVSGLLFAATSAFFRHVALLPAFLSWSVSDALGTAVIAPACIAMYRTHFRTNGWTKDWRYPAMLAVVTLGAFSTIRVPFIFLIYPLLLLILLRKGMGWAAASTLFVAFAGGWLTFRGLGPFAVSAALYPAEPSLLIQLFVAAGMFMLYHVSVIVEHQKKTERRRRDLAALHALILENSRDGILIADIDGKPRYVSPSLEKMTGWKLEEFMLHAKALLHPEDLLGIEESVQTAFSAGNTMAVYRLKTRDGPFVWVEASIKSLTHPKTGLLTGTLSIIRDISERKRAERQIEEAYHALETLAVTDSLTGLANRRRFDQYLANEWRRSLREQTPLSLLFMDVDLFKLYNDAYGHLRGDHCLRQIAAIATDVVMRPGDLVARFGGEEFAIVLPNTSYSGAWQIAVGVCTSVRTHKIVHCSDPKGTLSVSLGCATLVPRPKQNESLLIELADRALYEAKRQGRDRVVDARDLDTKPSAAALD